MIRRVPMNYTYTSSRVRALENRLIGNETFIQLIDCKSADECIKLLNSVGVDGQNMDEVIDNMSKNKTELINQLIDDTKEIEVIFYKNTFHNLKSAIKLLYTKSDITNMFYSEALIDGETIKKNITDGRYDLLPKYMSEAAKEAYQAILRTGNGQLSDSIVDRACLLAMIDFANNTKHEILKQYVNETVVAADIKMAFRNSADTLEKSLVDCSHFKSKDLIEVSGDKAELEEYIKSQGFSDFDPQNIDNWSEKRIFSRLRSEMYNIFTPSPAIYFILTLEQQINLVRMILVCKQNDVDTTFIRSKLI